MSDTTTNRGYTFPESTDNTNLWEWFETLAQDVDNDVQDNIFGPWTSYTPSFTTSGGGSPTPGSSGNAAIGGRYRQSGKTVDVKFWLRFGTGASGGSGAFRISMPSTPIAATFPDPGSAYLRDVSGAGTGHYVAGLILSASGAYVEIIDATAHAMVTSTVPFAWADGDFFVGRIRYEEA